MSDFISDLMNLIDTTSDTDYCVAVPIGMKPCVIASKIVYCYDIFHC